MRRRIEEKRKRRTVFGVRTLVGWFLFQAFAMEVQVANKAGKFKKSWKKLKMTDL